MLVRSIGLPSLRTGRIREGVWGIRGVLKDPAKSEGELQSVYGGSRNAGKVAVLEEGMKYQQIGIPPEEPQFLETRKFQIASSPSSKLTCVVI